MRPETIQSLNTEITAERISCEKFVAAALARATDPQGEGAATFRSLRRDQALQQARAHDLLRKAGATPSPLAGLPVSIKDNIDFVGEVTGGGCKLLEKAPPATAHAAVVRRLHTAGAVIVGRTNMTELAFSGIGYNRFYGTPANPFDRARKLIPGGSSSGAAISVTDGMAVAALGTDTGGSVRIPAAITGLVSFKPTQRRVPLQGVLPLSTLLDCVGPLAGSVADCALLDSILAEDQEPLIPFRGRLRLCTADDFMLADADPELADTYARAKKTLLDAGASIEPLPPGMFAELDGYYARGSFANAEAWERFGALIEGRPRDIDPKIGERVVRGRTISASDWIANLRARAAMMERFVRAMLGFDAVIAPTVPILPPPIADMEDDENYRRANSLILRNPAVANLLDAPSLTIPCHEAGRAPVGLMLIGTTMSDRNLLNIGAALEALLAR